MTAIVHTGDALAVLRTLPAESIHCCVTSPPYWGLRDYGVEGQIGMEDTPSSYIARLVDVFAEVGRLLRADGTIWLNLGDSFAGKGGGGQGKNSCRDNRTHTARPIDKSGDELKPKDLVGIPWRVAFALQAAGFYLRSDIIWHKPNPMPESVTDRPTRSHEYLFLFAKSESYYYDSEAIAEQTVEPRGPGNLVPIVAVPGEREGGNANLRGSLHMIGPRETRNKRDVWTITSKPVRIAHFATMPPDLVEPCVLAGCPESGTVLDPFTGSGTTGMVALQHHRNFIGIELNPAYAEMARKRIAAADPIGKQLRVEGVA